MDGPEIIMDAEEYLTPKARQPLSSTTTMTTNSSETPPPNTPTKKAPSIAGSDFSSAFPESPGPMTGTFSSTLQDRHRRAQRFRDSVPSMRYIGDPIAGSGKIACCIRLLHLFWLNVN